MRVGLALLLLIALFLALIAAGCGGVSGLGSLAGRHDGNPPLPGTGAPPPTGGGGGTTPPAPPVPGEPGPPAPPAI